MKISLLLVCLEAIEVTVTQLAKVTNLPSQVTPAPLEVVGIRQIYAWLYPARGVSPLTVQRNLLRAHYEFPVVEITL